MNTKYILALVLVMLSFAGIAQASILPDCDNVACPTTCGYQGGSVTNGNFYWNGHAFACSVKSCQAPPACLVDGGWGEWSDYSSCDQIDCGTVCTKTRTRFCDSPYPSNGGANCVGDASETTTENNPSCDIEGTCPTACGNATSTVSDGLGGTKDCQATEACVVPTPDLVAPEIAPVVGGGIEGQYVWRNNPQRWLEIRIRFLQARIARLQDELKSLFGK